jgi:hypothetical protein
MGLHSEQTTNHRIESWSYANAAARTGASGFTSGDVGRVAYQQDTGEYWRLTATTPTWALIGGGTGTFVAKTGDTMTGLLNIFTGAVSYAIRAYSNGIGGWFQGRDSIGMTADSIDQIGVFGGSVNNTAMWAKQQDSGDFFHPFGSVANNNVTAPTLVVQRDIGGTRDVDAPLVAISDDSDTSGDIAGDIILGEIGGVEQFGVGRDGWVRCHGATINGGQSVKRTAVSGDYAVLATDYLIAVLDTAAPRTISLPAAASVEEGTIFIVKDESGGAATNNITVDGNLTEQIDGAGSKTITTNYGAVKLYTDGAGWFTLP